MAQPTQPGVPWSAGDGAYRVRRLIAVFGPSPILPPPLVLDRPVVIGRDPEEPDAVALDDAEASRRHVQLTHDTASDRWIVADLGSRNGTWVDGARHDAAPLRDGSVVRVGRTLFVYQEVELERGETWRRPAGALGGSSVAMLRVRRDIAVVAPSPSPVLILGETGVGKELAAREVHALSGRSGRFVPVNCAALPAELAESELFGHAAGAFTGATARVEGLVPAAHQGTLFLDEAGELPERVQAKLLRALALGEVRPVGRTEPAYVDVRVVSATHRDLPADVASGRFRADLYARLNGVTITIPPLRHRKDDVLELGRRFLDGEPGRPSLTVGAAEALLLHDWPFNVRELEEVLRAAAVRARGKMVRSEHLPEPIARPILARRPAGAPPETPLDDPSARPQTRPSAAALRQLIERCDGNVAQAAQMLGTDRRQIYRWAKRYAIDLDSLRRDKR